MSDTYQAPPGPSAFSPATSDERTLPAVIYGLYLGGFLTGGMSTLAGLIMAYVLRDEGTPFQQSHYEFQIRTIWILIVSMAAAIGLAIVGIPLSIILVGILFWIASGLIFSVVGLWFVVRCAVGLARVLQDRPYPYPRSWFL